MTDVADFVHSLLQALSFPVVPGQRMQYATYLAQSGSWEGRPADNSACGFDRTLLIKLFLAALPFCSFLGGVSLRDSIYCTKLAAGSFGDGFDSSPSSKDPIPQRRTRKSARRSKCAR